MSALTQEQLKRVLHYDPQTGVFTWLDERPNQVSAGERAGYTRKDGYLVLVLNNRNYLGHRVAWLYQTGEWPAEMIDHINGDPSDNRFANLRAVTRSQNMMNMAVPPANTSGFKGVSRFKQTGKWEAYITVNRVRSRLGYFNNIEDAVAARLAAERRFFGNYARPQAVNFHSPQIEGLGRGVGGVDLPRTGRD